MTNAGSMAPPPISMTAGAPTPPVFAAPAAVPAPAAAPQKKASPQAGGRIQQAQLIVRKEPVYPPLARQTGVKGAVEVQATIGADGKVKNVKVLHGHPMLQKAAVDAIMQWVYKPTMLNGVAVESQTQIILNFVGEK
jgi:protein TonB